MTFTNIESLTVEKGSGYDLSVVNTTLRATYPMFIEGDGDRVEDQEGVIVFTLTPEGLIADIMDASGEVVATFAQTAQEFGHGMLWWQ
jgi:hypothetical protein